jgi:hypothetical protein
MIKLSLVLCVLFAVSAAVASELEISVNPISPYLIAKGSPINGTSPVTPYFTINNLKVTWSGIQEFEVLAIAITAKSNPSINCGGSGDIVSTLFSNSTLTDKDPGCSGIATGTSPLSSTGNVILPMVKNGCSVSIESQGFFCDNLGIAPKADPFASYNIPMTVTVIGQAQDSTGANQRMMSASTDIVIY